MHFASPAFWKAYEALPADVRDVADKSFTLLKSNPQHRSLRFKRVRAIGRRELASTTGCWIGKHDEYDRLIDG